MGQAIYASGKVRTESGERGYTLILFAGMAATLLAFTGLAIDVGYLQLQKRRMQTAADAGAVAAGQELLRGNTSSYATYAKNDTAANGFTDGTGGTVVTVAMPPATGAFAGVANYVEVAITQPQNTFFMQILGVTSVPMKARSVVMTGNSGACVYLLDPSVQGAYHSDGGTQLTANCGMKVNSSDPTAIDNQGSTQMQGVIGVRGGYSNQGVLTPTPRTGIGVVYNPLAGLVAPSQPGAPVGNSGTTTISLHPGYYSSGINIGANAVATMAPGLYFVNGNVWVGQDATLTGTGVTIYATGQLYGNHATVNLAAPNAASNGTLEGIVFWSTLSGSGSQCVRLESDTALTITGVVYCPQSNVWLESHSATIAPYTEFVAMKMDVIGSLTRIAINNDYSALAHGNPIKDTALLSE